MSDNKAFVLSLFASVLLAAAIAIPCSIATYRIRAEAFRHGYVQEPAVGSDRWYWVKP